MNIPPILPFSEGSLLAVLGILKFFLTLSASLASFQAIAKQSKLKPEPDPLHACKPFSQNCYSKLNTKRARHQQIIDAPPPHSPTSSKFASYPLKPHVKD